MQTERGAATSPLHGTGHPRPGSSEPVPARGLEPRCPPPWQAAGLLLWGESGAAVPQPRPGLNLWDQRPRLGYRVPAPSTCLVPAKVPRCISVHCGHRTVSSGGRHCSFLLASLTAPGPGPLPTCLLPCAPSSAYLAPSPPTDLLRSHLPPPSTPRSPGGLGCAQRPPTCALTPDSSCGSTTIPGPRRHLSEHLS